MENMIAIDSTIFIQLANFLITVVVLNYLLVRPIRRQIASRRAFTAEQADAIETFTNVAKSKLTDYESALAEARAKASVAREAHKTEGYAIDAAIVSKAQAEVQRFLTGSREEVSRERAFAMETLNGQVEAFAEKAAAKIFN